MPKTNKSLTDKQKGALEAIHKINNEMYDKVGWENHNVLLSIDICSWYFLVYIESTNFKINLYNSEQDDRIYYEKSDKYEEWYSFLKRKFREIKQELQHIKL